MRMWATALLAAVILATGTSSIAAAGDASPQSFVETIYRAYEQTGKSPAYTDSIFTAELTRLIQQDSQIANRRGEPNLIDYELLCGCQDNDGLHYQTSVTSASATSAVARIDRYFGRVRKGSPFELRLTRSAAGWRIADIMTPVNGRSESLLTNLRDGLNKSNAPTRAPAASYAGGNSRDQQLSTAGCRTPGNDSEFTVSCDGYSAVSEVRTLRAGAPVRGGVNPAYPSQSAKGGEQLKVFARIHSNGQWWVCGWGVQQFASGPAQAQLCVPLAQTTLSSPAQSLTTGRITLADKITAAKLFDLTFKSSKLFDECGGEAPLPEVTDLNGDGLPELIFYDGVCLGGNAGWVGIAAQKAGGGWKIIFADQGVLDVQKVRRNGWPDLKIGKPGMGKPPVYHWLGNRYDVAGAGLDDSPIAVPTSSGTAGKSLGGSTSSSSKALATPSVLFSDERIAPCTTGSGADCDLIITPPFRQLLAPTCRHNDIPIFSCADGAIRFAEARSLTGIYIIYFQNGEPDDLGGGQLPIDRFYSAAYLEQKKNGTWRLRGPVIKGGLLSCPDYGLSSLHVRTVRGVPEALKVGRFVKCDVVNSGQFTYRDPALAGAPPFIRP